MPPWITPLLWPVWWKPTSGSRSSTTTRWSGWRASSSRAVARPRMPAPTTTTSACIDLDARGREPLLARVEVVEPHDLAVAELVHERVLPVDLDSASSPGGPHPQDRHHLVTRVDELLRLETPLRPRLAPVGQPLKEASVSAVAARIGDVVVLNHRLLVEQIPEDLALRDEAVEGLTHQLDGLLGHDAQY